MVRVVACQSHLYQAAQVVAQEADRYQVLAGRVEQDWLALANSYVHI